MGLFDNLFAPDMDLGLEPKDQLTTSAVNDAEIGSTIVPGQTTAEAITPQPIPSISIPVTANTEVAASVHPSFADTLSLPPEKPNPYEPLGHADKEAKAFNAALNQPTEIPAVPSTADTTVSSAPVPEHVQKTLDMMKANVPTLEGTTTESPPVWIDNFQVSSEVTPKDQQAVSNSWKEKLDEVRQPEQPSPDSENQAIREQLLQTRRELDEVKRQLAELREKQEQWNEISPAMREAIKQELRSITATVKLDVPAAPTPSVISSN